MSIKKSLRLSIILLSSLPLIFITFLIYAITYSKYSELAKNSAMSLAKTYGNGFNAQLDVQIAEVEGLSNSSDVQNIALESYNGVNTGHSSKNYPAVSQLLSNTSSYNGFIINYYIYDINGYLMASSDSTATNDWSEYMSTAVTDIKKTTIMKSSNINKNTNSIEIVAPIKVKNNIVGLVRANIPAEYFGAFMPKNGGAFILTQSGDYLFSATGFNNDKDNESASSILTSDKENGYLNTDKDSIENIYGYYRLDNQSWLYFIKQDGKEYSAIISTLPITLIISLIVILIISIRISHVLTYKYTNPIITLKNDMKIAANGDLELRTKINERNEFGELATMFNNMMEIISSNYNQLNESKKILEANEIELKKNYDHIEQLAYHDGLTGLYNRVAFMKFAYEVFNTSGASLSEHAVFFIDLDNFKNINDTLGHDYGDLLLKQVSDKLTELTQKDDILARTGGDEFLILRPNYKSVNELKKFAQSLIDIVRTPFDLDGETGHVSMSLGISCFPDNGLTISELIKNADIAMYTAKTSGKNQYRFFESFMDDDVNRKNELTDILEKVIDKNEVYLKYQPQVNITTGEITGYEALMRINSDEIGNISPAEFIPIAEDSGLINQLGEWALYEACIFNQKIIKSGLAKPKVSVNVSTSQLEKNDFVEIIKSIPSKTGMDLKYLEIEITESVLMDSFEHNLDLINKIKELGVSIALDDFGTGYSSFNYLTQLPIDTLKIDKSFIDGICSNEKDEYIADTIISLAHKMDIAVVAEGVEDTDQLAILKAQLCDTLQGYLFSKPLDAVELIKLLNSPNKATLS